MGRPGAGSMELITWFGLQGAVLLGCMCAVNMP